MNKSKMADISETMLLKQKRITCWAHRVNICLERRPQQLAKIKMADKVQNGR